MSALIWLAIVGVWGFVLIPMWLRHHDGALEQRSADRFSTAMRVLSRRGAPARADEPVDSTDPAADDDEAKPRAADAGSPRAGEPATAPRPSAEAPAGTPARAAGAAARDDRERRPASRGGAGQHGDADETAHTVSVGPTRPVTRSRSVDPERRALLRLRRQRLTVLLAAVPVTIGLAIALGGMWIVVQLLVDLGLVVYVAHLRRAAQTERRLAQSRAARDRRIAAEREARRAVRAAGPAYPVSGAVRTLPPGAASPRQAGRPHVSTGRPASRPASPELAPVRLGDPERAAAAGTASGSPQRPSSPAVAEPPAAASGAAGADGSGQRQRVTEGAGASTGTARSSATGAAAADDPQAVDGYVNNVRVTSTRPAGRPSVRPPTSRPGRVQVNPPGTHGGLTAPPAAASGGPAATDGAPAATAGGAADATSRDAEVTPILRRAVGD